MVDLLYQLANEPNCYIQQISGILDRSGGFYSRVNPLIAGIPSKLGVRKVLEVWKMSEEINNSQLFRIQGSGAGQP